MERIKRSYVGGGADESWSMLSWTGRLESEDWEIESSAEGRSDGNREFGSDCCGRRDERLAEAFC